MGDISPGYLFVPSEGRDRLTSIKLNAAGNGATINPSFVARQPQVFEPSEGDQLLMLLAGGTYARILASDLVGDSYYTEIWNWTTKTADAANKGQVGINAASWAAATFVNANQLANDGRDMSVSFSELFTAGNEIYLQVQNDSATYGNYTIGGAGTDMGAWWQFPVTLKSSSGGLPGNNTGVVLTLLVKGGGGGGTSGGGDMLKSTYDTNNNGKVDTCDSLPWGSVTGKPAIGDMTKAVYDTNGNGVVDTADAIGWTAVTGKPTTFPPDSTAMLKSVYDVNGDGISDHAALADTAPWTGISGKPATFPPDSTAMLKSVYDTNADGISDHAALANTAPWTGITGKPATFPPDSTAMLKSVYDTNGDGISDHAALADAVPWTGISGKPASFPPSNHAATHLDNGSDPVPVVTATRTGLAPMLSGDPATFLNGTGVFSAVGGSGTVDPGVWTNLSLGAGWTAPVQAQFRIQTAGAVKTVFFRGMIQAAYSALGTTAFTLPTAAFPSMTRSTVLGGAQNTGTASDVAAFIASVSSAGVATIYFLGASAFVWADKSQTQMVYLDGLGFSL